MTFVQDVREKTALGSERRVIALAILSILILSVLLVFGAILIGASNLNATALRTSRSLATTVFAREAAALTRLTADNSWWDIARENLVDELDPVWADDNIGSYMHDTFDVTSVFVLDVEGDLIIAFHEGEQTDQDPDELMGPTLRNFALTHNQSTADQAPPCRSGIFNGISGLSNVAICPITPEYEVEGENGPLPRPTMIFTRTLDEAFVSNLGNESALNKLKVSNTAFDIAAQVQLPGLVRSNGAFASWEQHYPGQDMVRRVALPAAMMLITIALLSVLVLRRANMIIAARQVLAKELSQERALRETKSRFVSMISHEIRTPLANIQSAADMIDRYGGKLSNVDQKHELEAIRHAVLGINRIIENVVSIDRLEAGDSAAHTEAVPLADYCQEIWDEVSDSPPDSHPFELNGSGRPVTARADTKLLRTVLSNLFQNARKYSAPGTLIRVDVSETDSECLISVTDSGRGIPHAEMNLIFDPFYRGSNTADISGMGLGLAIVKTAIEHMGGTIAVSTPDGNSTCFTLSLPRASRLDFEQT